MKALGFASLIAVSILVAGCSETDPAGPAPVNQSTNVMGMPEGQYLPLSGTIGIKGENTEARWYALEGTVEAKWLPAPGPGTQAMELHLLTEAKLSCIANPEHHASVASTTMDRIEPKKMSEPIVKRFRLDSNHEPLTLVLVFESAVGEVKIREAWLEKPLDGDRIVTER